MYTEEYDERGFSIKKILFRFLIIVIIIILIVFLMAKIIMPRIDKKQTSNSVDNINEIMEENASTIKNSIFIYYSNKELPTEEERITINQLISKGVLNSLKDVKNNKLDYDESYIQIKKVEKDYILKINLKTVSNEKYYMIYFGDYDYCKTKLCEKDDTKILESNNNTKNNQYKDEEYDENTPIKQSLEEANENKKEENEKKENAQGIVLYQYEKITPTKISDWSEWTNWEKTTCTFDNITCDQNDENCLIELKIKRESDNTVCYKSLRKRTKLSSSYKTTRWSIYEDKELLKDGWEYTGQTKNSK